MGEYQFETKGTMKNKMRGVSKKYMSEQRATLLNKRSNNIEQKEKNISMKQEGQQHRIRRVMASSKRNRIAS
jgi:hypothetical protein